MNTHASTYLSTDPISPIDRLTAMVASLTEKIAAMESARQATLEPAPGPNLHPIEIRILDALQAGKAVRVTELAKTMGGARTNLHYHCKRLVLKGFVMRIQRLDAKHAVDWVIKVGAVPIPGIDA